MDETAAAEKKFTDGAAPIIGERTVKYVKAEKDKLVIGTAADNVWRDDTALTWANHTVGDLNAQGNVQRGLASASNLLADQARAAIAETKALWWQGISPAISSGAWMSVQPSTRLKPQSLRLAPAMSSR